MILQRHAARSPRIVAALAFVAAFSLSLPALAVQVVKVRAGAHPKFTRVVFELDGPAGYSVEEVGTEAAPMLRVSVDAGTRFHRLSATGDIRAIKVSAGTRTVATIALGRSDLRVQEMILSKPHRIVLDLYRPETDYAAEPAPTKKPARPAKTAVAEKKPEPPAAAPEPAQKPAPVSKPTAEATPAKEPEATLSRAPVPEPVSEASAKPTPEPIRKIAVPLVPKPEEPLEAGADSPESTRPEELARAMQAEQETEVAAEPAIRPTPEPAIRPAPRAIPSTEPAPAKPTAPGPASGATASSSASWMERLTGDPLWQGGLAAAVLLFVGVVFFVVRRHRALPTDLDVGAIAEEIGGEDRYPAAGFAMDEVPAAPSAAREEASRRTDAEASFAGLFPSDEESSAPLEKPRVEEPAFSGPASAPEVAETAPGSSTESLMHDTGGLVGEQTSEGDAPMNQDMDLPIDPTASASPPVVGGAASPSADVMQMLQDFERRIQTLEAKLDESNEAREKLERQVAAQSEELRVQRAAIARTQRALRTMSRAEEDKATEPALREGDTQAKTRINV